MGSGPHLFELGPEPPGSFCVAVRLVQVGETDLRKQAVRRPGERGFVGLDQSRCLAGPPREVGKLASGPPVAEERGVSRTCKLVTTRALVEAASELHEIAVRLQRGGVVTGAFVGTRQ